MNEIMYEKDRLAVRDLCEQIGYGFVIGEAARQWAVLDDVGAFTIGPCKAFTVPCECRVPHECEWCNGAGWLTEHVKAIKDNQENQS